jgi:predicted amidophosphoribosyltransferase
MWGLVMANNTKLCQKCGEEFPDTYSFCPYDGEALEDIQESLSDDEEETKFWREKNGF